MSKVIVLLDNGHGTPVLLGGKCSPDKRILEPKWAREMVRRIEALLKERGIETMRVTPEETDVSISERVRRVNAVCAERGAKNCLLISVHNNAFGSDGQWHEPYGWSVFVSKNASASSKRMAAIFTRLASAEGLTKGRSVPSCGYWTWDWRPDDIGILKRTACPAVLTENLFMDNRGDASYLASTQGKEVLALLHARAVEEYVNSME